MTRSCGATCSATRCRPRYVLSLCRMAAIAALASMLGVTMALAAADSGETAGAASGATQPAHWVKKKIFFVYQGFTTHYSCEGLTENVRSVLLQLGARKSDLNVHETGCTGPFGSPQPSPAVAGTFSVLEPASSSSSAAGPPVKARWHTVHVKVGRPGLESAGQCELVDQVKTRILPLFAARDVQFQSHCVPHQLTIQGSSLTVQVLKPVAQGRDVAQSSH